MMELLSTWFAPGPFFGWLCVAGLGLLPLIWWRARSTHGRPAIRFSRVQAFLQCRPSWVSRTRFILPLLRSMAVLLLVLALARPQGGGEYRDTSKGIAIQMVLDVSGSMAETDFVLEGRPVRRLDAVKQVFEDFVLGRGRLGGRESDLIGMTTLAMYVETPCPLTLDHGSLVDLLRDTEIPGWVDGRQVREMEEAGYTSLGDGIALAADDLRRAGEQAVSGVPGAEPARSRVMILLTDGKDNPPPAAQQTAPDPVEAARVAATLGIRVYTIGAVGDSPRGRSPLDFFGRPSAGFDESELRAIAAAADGKYFRATDVDSLKTIYDEIDKLERVRTGERSYHDNVRVASLAMLGALIFLFVELLLSNTRYRRLP